MPVNNIDPKIYFQETYKVIPRILSLQNRTEVSSSYGSFHRAYWLHRTFDFPSSIYQMSVHTLALLYTTPFEGNEYYKNKKIIKWCIAGFEYALSLQKRDGSFDEWYPNERGWAGPTGYLMHALCQAYFLLEDELPVELKERFKGQAIKSAIYLADYEELDILANHYGIALLPIYEIYKITGDKEVLAGFNKCFGEFEKYFKPNEGWFLEYDGPDIGYLAGTISFLARLHKISQLDKIKVMIEPALEFLSLHCYPDHSFGGSMGSRQTNIFYPFGFEYWSEHFSLAGRIALWGREGLKLNKMVTPSTQGDHYVTYRSAEYLEAYIQVQKINSMSSEPQHENQSLLPFERENFKKYFSEANIYIEKKSDSYLVINLAKGGVLKCFSISHQKSTQLDSGWIALTSKGRKLTNQWNDSGYIVKVEPSTLKVSGEAHSVMDKHFTPTTWIIFRMVMLLVGWNAFLSQYLKKIIRKLLMVGNRRSKVFFERTIHLEEKQIRVEDAIEFKSSEILKEIHLQDEFFVRYVPQSKYFTKNELETLGKTIQKDELVTYNKGGRYHFSYEVKL